MPRRWLTRLEAAEHARCSPATIDRWARLAPIKVGRRIDADLLDAYIIDGRQGVLSAARRRRRAA